MAIPQESPYRALYAAAGERYGVSPSVLEEQGFHESSWNPKAVSDAGARGIAQFMPGTGPAYGLVNPEDYEDPAKSIDAQARYMSDLKKRFGSDELALAAYNMGPTALQRRLDKAGGVLENAQIPEETRGYLQKFALGKAVSSGPTGAPEPSGIDFGTPKRPKPESAVDRIAGTSLDELGTDSERSRWDAFTEGLSRSTIGSALRAQDVTTPLEAISPDWTPSPADVERVSAAGVGEAGARFVFEHSFASEDIDGLIEIARENRASAAADGRQGVLTSLAGGVGEMLGDPITYGTLIAPSGALLGKLFNPGTARVLGSSAGIAVEGAAYGALTEATREVSTGVDADYQSAILAGAVGGVAIHGAFKGVEFGLGKLNDRTRNSFSYVEDMETAGVMERAGIIPETPYEPGPLTKEHLKVDTYNPVARISTIAERMRSSQNPEIQTAALGMFRNDKGYADGTSGLGRMTGEEVKRNLDNEFFDVDSTYSRHVEEFIGSRRGSGLSKAELEEEFGYMVTMAREGSLQNPPESVRQAAELMGKFYDARIEDVLFPGQKFGEGADILDNPKDWAGVRNYAPVIMDTAKIARAAQRVGGDEALVKIGGRALFASLRDPDVLQRAVKEFEEEVNKSLAEGAQKIEALEASGKATQEFLKWAQIQAEKQAMGYVDQDMSRIKAHLYKTTDPSELPDFMRKRGIFKTNAAITLPDGSKFSVDKDLRSGDVRSIMHSYHKRTAGDLAMAVGLGDKGFTGFAERLARIEQQIAKATREDNPKLKRELEGDLSALRIGAKKLYGMSLNQDGRGAADMIAGSLTNLSFVAKSAYMGPMNYTEISTGLANYGMGFFFKALPGAGKLVQRVSKGKATAEDLELLQNRLWGEEMHEVVYPSHLQSTYSLARENAPAPIAAVYAITQRLTEVAPSAKLLNATTNRIVKAAQEEFLAELVRHAHGRTSKVFADAKLKHMAVDPEAFTAILKHVKSSSKLGKGNKFSLDSSKFLSGSGQTPMEARKVIAEIRRMGDLAASDVIQRPSIGDTFIWADSKNPLIRFLTQFQTFSMRSLEKKLLKGVNRVRNGDVDEAMQMTLSLGLSGLGVTAFAVVRGQTIRDETKREEFYKNALGYDTEEGEWDFTTLAVGALKRSSYLAAPSLAYDTIGTPLGAPYAGLARTSVETAEEQGKSRGEPFGKPDFGQAVGNLPAVKYATNLGGALVAPINMFRPDLDEEQVERQKRALLFNLKGILPNDPATQTALSWLIENSVEGEDQD
ncbi:hypothetical protein DBR00_02440 [Pseudomonas sp. HMWF032]|uniref:transglycosylase SLT domain-containing protein n=1 Tax=Pseudomonas sp. HMWF032 TaxID=2056866 RepID=UPI000D383F65|nr:transglycosylase SLT domain-containing protein [Pseudomonas sp. HMWF032]PTS86433.1 hypothetical protein DBR00_02440 [Pseudomonas sp. HMWF032]PTT81378.1 hypothetical protein DBR41_17090 [Pseudomonas sp. HMWF010]